MTSISISENAIFEALRSTLLQMGLSAAQPGIDVPIIRGQVNRVPEPRDTDFVVMWPILRTRLAQNIDNAFDNRFTGSITANVLSITSLIAGNPTLSLPIYGEGVTTGARLLHQLSGPPLGIGTYSVSPTADVTSETIYNGLQNTMQKMDFVVQCDVHGPTSGDNAQKINTLFRDQFAVDKFQEQAIPIWPLYATDPKQLPMINAEEQYEERWMIELHMQVDPIIGVTMQFAERLHATATPVETLA